MCQILLTRTWYQISLTFCKLSKAIVYSSSLVFSAMFSFFNWKNYIRIRQMHKPQYYKDNKTCLIYSNNKILLKQHRNTSIQYLALKCLIPAQRYSGPRNCLNCHIIHPWWIIILYIVMVIDIRKNVLYSRGFKQK